MKNKKALIIICVAALLAVVSAVCIFIAVNSQKEDNTTKLEDGHSSGELEVLDDPDTQTVTEDGKQSSVETIVPFIDPDEDNKQESKTSSESPSGNTDKSTDNTSSKYTQSDTSSSDNESQNSSEQTGDNTENEDNQGKFGDFF